MIVSRAGRSEFVERKSLLPLLALQVLSFQRHGAGGKHPLSAYKRPLGYHDTAEHYLFTSVYHHVYYKKSFSIFPCRLGL